MGCLLVCFVGVYYTVKCFGRMVFERELSLAKRQFYVVFIQKSYNKSTNTYLPDGKRSRNKMKDIIKWILTILSLTLLFTATSSAEKKFVPIISDDLMSLVSYYTTTNNLKIPTLSDENNYKELVVQCEDDISYFIMAYHPYYQKAVVTVDKGSVVIEKQGIADGIPYLKGYIEGNESIAITGNVYYDNKIVRSATKTCRSKITSVNKLKVPTFNGNSQGKLVIQCENDVVFYIMAYDCLRSDTNPYAKTSTGTIVVDEKRHVGEVFYEKGHVERTGGPVTITGEVYTGGKTLTWDGWVQTCP
jgi:hypothetical protein